MNGVREEGSEAAAADQQCVSEILLEHWPENEAQRRGR